MARSPYVPRTARVVAVAAPHHVTQRGNNRQQIFFSNAQRRLYLALLAEQGRLHGLSILGYCLMPNHIHLVAVPGRQDALAKGVGRTNNAYSRYLNHIRGRSGHLWQNRFYSAPLDRGHVLRALRYVDLNPVRAGLAERATDWPWSSARGHVLGEDPAGVIDFQLWREIAPLGDWGHVLVERCPQDQAWSERLRAATHAGKPLGSKDFVRRLELQQGLSLDLRGPGRPRREVDAKAAAG